MRTAAETWAREQIQQLRLGGARARLRHWMERTVLLQHSTVRLEAACHNPIMLSPTARIVFPILASQTPQTS